MSASPIMTSRRCRRCSASYVYERGDRSTSTLCPACRPVCVDCGDSISGGDAERCIDCMALAQLRQGSDIDPHTRYEDDLRCQAVVSAHPDGINNDQIGQLLGISRERVRQILDGAIARLRKRCELAGITEDEVRDMLARRARA